MIEQILSRTRDAKFRDYLAELLLEVCRIDTTPNSDVSVMRAAEAAVFDIIERELDQLQFAGARYERRAVNPEICRHPAYSLLHFTKTAERPEGLSPEETYAGRGNLLYLVPGAGTKAAGENVAINGHVDIVAPFFPPRLENGVVYGRGACDDKGNVIAMLGALKVVNEVLAHKPLNRNITAMFVIEEETGGNGSLSLALDRELKKLYDSIVVLECTDNRLHPANRGALWYRAELRAPVEAMLNDFEMAAFVIEELEKEGRAIKSESRHKLFPQRPVQTCHGMIGHVGEHPSRICGEVGFTVNFANAAPAETEVLLRDIIDFALADYIGLYGDKTKVNDPVSGKPKVTAHYKFTRVSDAVYEVTVYGATGHMGSILENDGAITKMAHMLRGLVLSRAKLEKTAGSGFCLEQAGRKAGGSSLVLEGGQGFVPTHPIQEIMQRVTAAAQRGADNYRRMLGVECTTDIASLAKVTFDKLHNDAFDGDPDSAAMKNIVFAAKAAGIWKDEPVCGWTVSCDSRIFAGEYPDMPVVTTGAGFLAHAHADAEQLNLESMMRSVEMLAVYLLRQTGTFD